jgi:hypothetical protein
MDETQALPEGVSDMLAAGGAGNDLAETRAALLDRARQRFGRIDPRRIVDHVLRVTEDADFAVRKAALDALARRFSFGARDGVEIVASPPGATRLGSFTVGRRADRRTRSGKTAPRYTTAVLTLLRHMRRNHVDQAHGHEAVHDRVEPALQAPRQRARRGDPVGLVQAVEQVCNRLRPCRRLADQTVQLRHVRRTDPRRLVRSHMAGAVRAREGVPPSDYRSDILHWFCKPSFEFRTHHLHLVPYDSTVWRARLRFRDILRSDATIAAEYAALKLDLATRFELDREAYTEGKAPFITRALESAT